MVVEEAMSIGRRVPMIDARERVSGRIPYALDAKLPGMLVGKILHSPHPHARLVRVDVGPAERLAGVIAAVSRADVQDGDRFDPYYGPVVRDQPVVALDTVRYVGEVVAAVAAVDEETAEAALELIEAEYDSLPAVFDPLAALEPDAPRLHEDTGRRETPPVSSWNLTPGPFRLAGEGNLVDRVEQEWGNVEQGFRQADLVVEEEYRCPGVQHVPFEPHVAIASFEGSKLTVLSSTQTPHVVRAQLAEIFRLPLTHVRVVVKTLGGGYGAKCYPKIEPIAALLAWKARRPVKLVLERAEDFLATCRAEAVIRLKTGVRHDGTLVARQATCFFNKGAYTETGPRVIRMGGFTTSSAYRIPNVRIESCAVFTNIPPSGPFRGPGAAQAVWAAESHMDTIARRLGLDPLELRRKNLVQNGDRYVGGGDLEDLHFDELLDDLQRVLGPDQPMAEGSRKTLKRGRGVALCIKTTGTPSTSSAVCTLNEDGSLSVLTSSVEMGQGAKTVLSQIASDAVGVPFEAVSVSEPDTDLTPYDQTTSSSRTTYSMGTAIRMAGAAVRQQLAELAATELEVSLDDVLLANGRASVKGAAHRSASYGDLVRASQRRNLLGHGTFVSRAKPDPITGEPGASAHWHHAVAAVDVEVDTETGKVRLLACHTGVFAGRKINPVHCELQTEGSAIFGLGQGLMEELVFDDGRLINANLSDYLIPSFKDLPPVLTVNVLETPDSDEIHGIGETALPPVLAAVSNAVAAAIGATIHELPLTPERVLQALDGKQAGR
jgi:CO/xanthine dehydrogenase Mo-binding subunit